MSIVRSDEAGEVGRGESHELLQSMGKSFYFTKTFIEKLLKYFKQAWGMA